MWKLIFLFLLLYSCTPKFKEVVYKRDKDNVVVIQKGNFYPELDEESEKYVYIVSRSLHIPVPDRREIRKALATFLKNKERMERILEKMSIYEPLIVPIFKKYGLPEELKLLPVIESAYNPFAVSRAGAGGLWQFMPGTAKRYGLKITSDVDERFDVIKSTDAAARLLRDLYDRFKSWELALAAYHCGEGCVLRAKGDFWKNKNRLPPETRKYVPSFFAVLLLNRFPQKYGLKVEGDSEPLKFIQVNRETHVKEILRDLNLSYVEFKSLNPHIKGSVIPTGSYVYFR